MKNSLFGFLANRFSSHPENLATEALLYILSNSQAAKDAFIEYIKQASVTFEKNLFFQSQVQIKDEGVPDLIGSDEHQRSILIVESKFWAGLTDHQPLTYLKRLPPDVPAVLVFISPSKRVESLWAELMRRCDNNNSFFQEQTAAYTDIRRAKISATHYLLLVTWPSIVNVMKQAVDASNDQQTMSDLSQLHGLCDRMDTDAFLPLRSEEFAAQIGKRTYQYAQLVNEVTEKLINLDIVNAKENRRGGSERHYQRYMRVGEFGLALQFSFKQWAFLRETPLWLRIYGPDWAYSQKAVNKLSILPSLCQNEHRTLVPLFLPTNVEKDKVVNSLVEQVKKVSDLLLKKE
jgi:hypothetical protein